MNGKPLLHSSVEMRSHAAQVKIANAYIPLDIATHSDPQHHMAKAESPFDQLSEDLRFAFITPSPLTQLSKELDGAAEELAKAEMALAIAESRGENKCVIVCLMAAVAWYRKRLSVKRGHLPRIRNWFLQRKA